MKTIQKSLLFASLLLASTAASAQKVITQDLETWMSSLISRAIDNKVEVSKSFGQERDIQKEGTPLKWRSDIRSFSLPKKQRPLLDEMIKAFEANGHDNPNCYSINTLTTGNPQNEGMRNLMIGDDPNRYITIGQDYNNYINVNILDAKDTTKTHRYAYALEWREQSSTSERGSLDVRYIITYAKIPTSYTATMQYPSSDLANAVRDMIKNGRELWGRDFADGDLISNDNILLLFSKMKQQYLNGDNREFNAISIYLLCKRAREFGFFKEEGAKALLGQLKNEVRELVNMGSNDKAVLYYLQRALVELEQIR